MTPWDLVAAIRHRWALILGSLLVALLLVSVWTANSPRFYTSSATLLFGDAQPKLESTDNSQSGAQPLSFLGTQADIIRSEEVAKNVIRMLRLDQDPAVIARWRAATGGEGDIKAWLNSLLLANVTVWPAKNSNVLAVNYTSEQPEFAATIANGFAEAFVATRLKLQTEPAKVYSDWFAARSREVRQRLEAAQARMTQYQQEQGLIAGEKLDVEMSRLTELSAALAVAEAAAAETGGRARSSPSASPDVQASSLVAGLRANVATKRAEVANLSARVGPLHPELIRAKAELAAVQKSLDSSVSQLAQSLRVASTAALSREGELRQRLAQQRQRVLAMSGTQDRLAVLQRDVDAARAAYDAVTQRLNNVRLASAIPQTNVSLLDKAKPSWMPVSPNASMRLLLGGMLGLMLGITLAAALELRRPRVRSAAGLRIASGLPTLVELAPPQRRLALLGPEEGARQ